MPGLLDIISAPLKGLGDAVSEVAKVVGGDASARQAAAAQLDEAKVALQESLIQADAQLAKEQAEVIENEEKEGWLPANWRPILMLSFGLIIIYTYFIGPMFGLKTVDIPQQLWTIMTAGITGYVGLRSAEKIFQSDGVANIASIITGKPLPQAPAPAAQVATAPLSTPPAAPATPASGVFDFSSQRQR